MFDLGHRLNQDGTVLLESVVPGDGRRVIWLFEHPREIITARNGAELQALFDRLESAAAAGQYAAGYLSYEAGYALEPAVGNAPASEAPIAWFGIYAEPIELPPVALEAGWPGAEFDVGEPAFAFDRTSYGEAFRRLKHHIHEGDVYQINLTGPLSFSFEGSAPALYLAMARAQRRALGAFVNTGARMVLSRSPELFFERAGNRIVTRPMKGTYPRGVSAAEDEVNREVLARDPKSRAENLMIVDLLRNDLSVVCRPGTVQVPALFSTELHETLIQMTSTITGELRSDVTYGELFRALFPCGSVTGAPRIRAMQVIRELERTPRGVYCGSIGWIGPVNRSVFNVAIRTLEIAGDEGRLGVGSGVVWDSDQESEFEECLLKARFFFRIQEQKMVGSSEADLKLIESMRWRGGIALWPLHMRRLSGSAELLGFPFDPASVEARVRDVTREIPDAAHKIRVLLSRSGEIEVEAMPIPEDEEGPVRIGIAADRLASDDPLLRHKTTRRTFHERVYAAGLEGGVDEVLLLNERGDVCEATRANVVVRSAGALHTPPVASGLLPGVYRSFLLQTRTDIQERPISLADLMQAEQIFLCNAVRGMREAVLERDEHGRVRLIDVAEGASPATAADGQSGRETKFLSTSSL